MAHRFHCEQCGKRLQVDLMPLSRVMCPHCRNTQIVPADAAPVTSASAASPSTDQPPEEVSRTDGLVAAAAAYVPSWGTSVVLHLAVALLALMGAWTTVKPLQGPLDFNADFDLKAPPKIEHKTTPGGSRTLQAHQKDKRPDFSYKRDLTVPTGGITDFDGPPAKVIGIVGGSGGGRVGGDLSDFSRGRGGPGGPGDGDTIFLPTPHDQIVFVIDRSGSMTDSIMYVKYELRRYISRLRPSQKFHVIFYSSGPALEMPSRKLLPATVGNREMAFDFIDGIVPIGGTDPADALKAAFALKPDVIHFLSDGEFDRKVINQIDKLNAGKKTQVNTVCFIYTAGEFLLQEIAKRNNGAYRYVSEVDLDRIAGR